MEWWGAFLMAVTAAGFYWAGKNAGYTEAKRDLAAFKRLF